MPDSPDTKPAPKQCNRKPPLAFINRETGEFCRPDCNTYGCEHCGKRKIAILRKSIIRVLLQWKHVRMWTFTLTHKIGTIEEHRIIYQKVWRIFMLNIRRNKGFTENQRGVQFIRVWERCKDNYYHCHVFVDQYLNFYSVLNIWRNAIITVTKCDVETAKKSGGCNVNGNQGLSAEQAANYVTKYVTKQIDDKTDKNNRRYSKSNEIILFEYKEKNGDWIVVRIMQADFESSLYFSPETHYSDNGRTTAQNDLPPPQLYDLPVGSKTGTTDKTEKYYNNEELGALAD